MNDRLLSGIRALAIAALLMIWAAPEADAQFTERDHAIHLGATGGINAPWIIFPNQFGQAAVDRELSFSPGFGVHAGYQFREGFGFLGDGAGVRAGVSFAQLGQEFEDTAGGANYRRLSYVQIPVMVNLRFGQVERGFYLQGGPQLGILQDAEVVQDGAEDPEIEGVPVDLEGTDYFM